jgi:hypothetical protein
MTKEEFRQKVVELATPIDFDQLIRDGVLAKDGAWYRILDLKRLPKHASGKIKTIQTGPKGTKIKFFPVTNATLKLLHQVQG